MSGFYDSSARRDTVTGVGWRPAAPGVASPGQGYFIRDGEVWLAGCADGGAGRQFGASANAFASPGGGGAPTPSSGAVPVDSTGQMIVEAVWDLGQRPYARWVQFVSSPFLTAMSAPGWITTGVFAVTGEDQQAPIGGYAVLSSRTDSRLTMVSSNHRPYVGGSAGATVGANRVPVSQFWRIGANMSAGAAPAGLVSKFVVGSWVSAGPANIGPASVPVGFSQVVMASPISDVVNWPPIPWSSGAVVAADVGADPDVG